MLDLLDEDFKLATIKMFKKLEDRSTVIILRNRKEKEGRIIISEVCSTSPNITTYIYNESSRRKREKGQKEYLKKYDENMNMHN